MYLRSSFGDSLSTRMPKKLVIWPVLPLVFIDDLDPGWKQSKSQLTVETFLLTQCSLQLCLCLFCNQTQRFLYQSGECSYIEKPCMLSINTVRLSNGNHGNNLAVLSVTLYATYLSSVAYSFAPLSLAMISIICWSLLLPSKTMTLNTEKLFYYDD